MDIDAQLKALRQIRPSRLSPEEQDQAWSQLLALCQQLHADQRSRQGKGKGGGGGKGSGGAGAAASGGVSPDEPDEPGPSTTANRSSEVERREAEGRKPWEKRPKNAALWIDATVPLTLAEAELPPDAVFERFESVVVQDLVLLRWNTCFLRARYRSATTGKSYLAPLPPGYHGQFGPGVRSLALGLNYGANVSMPLVHRFLQQAGCRVSRGQVSRFLTERLEGFVAEAASAIRAAVAHHPWLQIDDTRSGVRTEHGCCHVLGNDLASYYVTTERGHRRSVVEALFLGAPVSYRLEERAFRCLERWDVARWVRDRLSALAPGAPSDAAGFVRWLDLRLPSLRAEPREQVLTAAALAGYHAQTEIPRVEGLLSDDASVFQGLADEHGLCWLHDFRHYRELVPERAMHERQFLRFKGRYWKLYRRLLTYRAAPTARERDRIERAFDQLVAAAQAPSFLAECIARTRKNKAKLLLVLAHPELPLHNNAAELDVRRRVRKRDVSFGPVSAAGRQAWDTFQGLAATAEKLGLSFWSYLIDRVREAGEIPPLSELIAQKASRDPRPTSWSAA